MKIGPRQAVIICDHVFDGAPILDAVRDKPVDPVDSGWQCHCGKFDHSKEQGAKIIAIKELLEIEPTLFEFLDLPAGTSIRRPNQISLWQIDEPDLG